MYFKIHPRAGRVLVLHSTITLFSLPLVRAQWNVLEYGAFRIHYGNCRHIRGQMEGIDIFVDWGYRWWWQWGCKI